MTTNKPYDATAKTLIRLDPEAWLEFLGVPVTAPVEIINTDLSSINLATDGLLKVGGGSPFGVNIECESGHTGKYLPDRLLEYNVLASSQTSLPFRSIAVLLTKKANSPALTGTLEKHLPDGTIYLVFHYRVIRLWEIPADRYLNAGLSLVPMTLLGDTSAQELPNLVEQMKARFTQESTSLDQEQELLAATYLLTGAKYSKDITRQLLKGAIRNVLDLRESSTYQEIREIGLAEGRAEGMAKGLEEGEVRATRAMIYRIGQKRFGEPDADIRSVLEAIADSEQLSQYADRLMEVETWEELLATESAS